jgi:2-amino-4-hydroxy-6-hydroxymethyldihydropteridine diphosphokinase
MIQTGEDSSTAHIGIGSNVGEPYVNCLRVVEELKRLDESRVLKVSSFYKTEPVGFEDQNWFINCAAVIQTTLTPFLLLSRLHSIENQMGRVRVAKWGPRVIDLDLLFFDDVVSDDSLLTLPHPELHKRRFVLEPLNEIDPEKVHPRLGVTIRELYLALNDHKGVYRLSC